MLLKLHLTNVLPRLCHSGNSYAKIQRSERKAFNFSYIISPHSLCFFSPLSSLFCSLLFSLKRVSAGCERKRDILFGRVIIA
uniref:Uncharacterized protein n=1 Tax=Rhizophora mucronata TaxID=61149 RepID=A0A2P2QHK0_RHIMU